MVSRADRLRNRLADASSAGSVAATLRARRWERFLDLFPDFSEMRVIDLGGTAAYWRSAPARPAELTLVNLSDQGGSEPWMSSVVSDVCELRADLRREQYDIVYSNSVIEHVGGHARRQQMADVIHSLSDRHWVQTPYRYFPIEPHWLFPGFQFLPTQMKSKVARSWPLAWSRPPDQRSAVANAMGVELLDQTQLRFYFPDSRLQFERVAGLTKSLIAVR